MLASNRPVVIDGGLATELEAQGHDLTDGLWSARLCATSPRRSRRPTRHTCARVGGHDLGELPGERRVVRRPGSVRADAEELLAAASSSRSARGCGCGRGNRRSPRPSSPRRSARTARSSAEGQEYSGDYGDVDVAELEAFHERRLRVLLSAGPDCIACETIPRADEAAILADLLDRLSAPPSWISFTCRDGESTYHGEPIELAVAAAARVRPSSRSG